jgi:hypothetical protein
MVVVPFLVALASGCIGGAPLYPPRPPSAPGTPIADPPPSRVVVHTTLTGKAMASALEEAAPKTGSGTFPMLGKERTFTWEREPLSLAFSQGRVGIGGHVKVRAEMPVGHLEFSLDLKVLGEPVITSEYVARLQSLDVAVTSRDTKVRLADALGGVLEKIRGEMAQKLGDFSYDLKPLVSEAYGRISEPIDLPLGDAHGCAAITVLGVEAGPTVLADGIEKDLALIVAPSVTLPCAVNSLPPPLPPLANVANVPSGPFTIQMPVAARYEELAKAMSLTFTDGKYFFSKEFPGLYMEKPEIYAGRDELVLKVHIKGPVHKFGGDHDLDGDLFLTGHPTVIDNEVRIPDLEPTIETKSFLLKLKATFEGDQIRDSARQALRLDLGERLASVREKLSKDLSFANGQGCMKADVLKAEITGVYAHATYLRVQTSITARAAVYAPCPQ